MQGHANAPAQVLREAQRLFPLDLSARIEYLYEMAHASTNEADRHAIYQGIHRLKNGV